MRVIIVTAHGTPVEFELPVVYEIFVDGDRVYSLLDSRPEEPVDERQT